MRTPVTHHNFADAIRGRIGGTRSLAPAIVAACLLLTACTDSPISTEPAGPVGAAQSAGASSVIVVLKERPERGRSAVNREHAAEVARGLGIEPTHVYGAALVGFAATVPAGRIAAIRQDPRVAFIDQDRPVSLPPRPVLERLFTNGAGTEEATGGSAGTQVVPWGVHRLGASATAATGAGVHVYILDTGIDPDHPDLKANLGEGFTAFACKGNPKNCPGWRDDNGHGTHVAGTVGAIDNGIDVVGVAPGVTLHAVKVLSSTGSGAWSGIIAGIDWVASHNADRPRVANMSLGGFGGKHGTCTEEGLVGSTMAPYAAICNAKNAGVVFAVAAGNSSQDASSHIPAAFYDAVITVSASTCTFIDGTGQHCSGNPGNFFMGFSNWGTKTDPAWPSRGTLPVLVTASGTNVLSTAVGGGTRWMGGTSAAAPHVAGVAALLLEGGSHPATGAAFLSVRTSILANSECTVGWSNSDGYPHNEYAVHVNGSDIPCGVPIATGLTATVVSSSEVALSWTNNSGPESRFEIRNSNAEQPAIVATDTTDVGVTSYIAGGLTAGIEQWFNVRAIVDGQMSGGSNHARVTIPVESGGDDDPPAGAPPVATFNYSCTGLSCHFLSTSTAENGVASLAWSATNGQNATGETVTFTSNPRQNFTVTLTVTDGAGLKGSASTAVKCNPNFCQ